MFQCEIVKSSGFTVVLEKKFFCKKSEHYTEITKPNSGNLIFIE